VIAAGRWSPAAEPAEGEMGAENPERDAALIGVSMRNLD
jgi:hypothetical protein